MSMIVFAAALAAAASPEPAPAPAAAPVAPVERSTSIRPSTDMRRVCVVDSITGSRMDRKYCQTRAEWVAQGTDPLATRR